MWALSVLFWTFSKFRYHKNMCCSERAYPLFRGNNHVETRTPENKLKLEPDGGHIFRSWNDFRKWLAVY